MAHCDVAFTQHEDAPRDVLILEPICDMRLQRKQRLCSTCTPPRSDSSPLFTGQQAQSILPRPSCLVSAFWFSGLFALLGSIFQVHTAGFW